VTGPDEFHVHVDDRSQFRRVTLTDGTVAARFVPEAGMVGASLTDAGVELLGLGKGLDEYVANGVLFGLPVMHPWANRLGGYGYSTQSRTVTLTAGQPGLWTDGQGLVIHGLLAAHRGWRIESLSSNELTAVLDFGAHPELIAGFPYPHELALRVTLRDRTLTIATTVTATSDVPVPLCFGFHPYLTIPDVPREQWVVETPPMRHLELDAQLLPTGGATNQPARSAVLGDTVFDDGYDQVADGAVFAVSGGGRRVEVRFETGYPAAQVYAPIDQDVICFEPMAAPTDALRRGGYRCAMPNEPAEARFSIRV